MGSCCSKIDSKNECASFNGALHPSLEQWQPQSTCQLCQLNGFAGRHEQCCLCDSCRKSASSSPRYGVKGGFVNGGSSHREPRCSLCAADAYEAQLHQASHVRCSQSSDPSIDDDTMHCDPLQSDHSTKQDLTHSDHLSKHGVPGNQYALRYDLSAESDCAAKHEGFMQGNFHAAKHDFLLMDNHTLFEPNDEMLPSRTLASSTKASKDVIMFSNIAAYEFLSSSMRLARSVRIDDSDGIKLEVRYKHMLPHDVQRSSVHCASPPDDHVLKRNRSSEKLVSGDLEANRSVRRRKSFQVDSADLDLRFEHGEVIMSEIKNDDIDDDDDDDDEFHDITVGVSISSLPDPGYTINGLPGDSEHCLSMHPSHQLHDTIPINMNPHVQDGLHYVANDMGMLNLDVSEANQLPVYLLSKENMQFISKEERAWEVRAEAMGIEDKISRTQALSVVSTGDALLFSGANSEEFHLIPSMFVQHPKSPVLSPIQKPSPPRLMTNERDELEPEKGTLSVEDIILLLENDELNEDDLFSLLIESCLKSSPSSSPSSSSSSEASMIWSSPLSSSSSSSSSSSTLSSSASSSSTSIPWLPSSSTSMLQRPLSSTTCSLSLPYSLSLPVSCKMSPHTSFEFKVKSCSSTPSTPVFSPIRSRTKRNIAQLKPNALTTGEIAEIWGLFKQSQSIVAKQCT